MVESDLSTISGFLRRIAQGLSMIAERLPEHAKDISALVDKINTIDVQLNYLIQETAKDANSSRVRGVQDDIMLLRRVLDCMADLVFLVIEGSREIEVHALWQELVTYSQYKARIAFLEQACIIEDFVEALVAMSMGLSVNPCFVRLQTEMELLGMHYLHTFSRVSWDREQKPRPDYEADAVAGAEEEPLRAPFGAQTEPFDHLSSTQGVASNLDDSKLELPKQWPKVDHLLAVDEYDKQVLRSIPGGPSRFRLVAAQQPEQRAFCGANFPKFNYQAWEQSAKPAEFTSWRWGGREEETVPAFDIGNVAGEASSIHVEPNSTTDERGAGGQIGPITKEDIDVILWSRKDSSCPLVMRTTPPETGSTLIKHMDSKLRSKWWHLHRQDMSLAEFKAVALNGTADEAWSRAAVSKVFADVQQRSKEGGCNDHSAGSMLVQTRIDEADAMKCAGTQAKATFISLPYVHHYDRGISPRHNNPSLVRSHQGPRDTLTTRQLSNQEQTGALHIATVWILIVGECFLLTCADMSLDALRDCLISTEPSTTPLQREIEVRSEGNRAWLIPVAEASLREPPTIWITAAFGQRMTDIAGCDPLAALYDPGLQSERGSGRLRCRNICERRRQRERAYLCPTNYGIWVPSMGDIVRDFDARLRVAGYNVLSVITRAIGKNVDETAKDAVEKADVLHQGVLNYHCAAHVACYNDQAQRTRADIEHVLNTRHGTELVAMRSDGKLRDERLLITIMAMYIFDFFWPSDVQHKMLDKFWGAVEKVLHYDMQELAHSRDGHGLQRFCQIMHAELAVKMIDMSQDFADSKPSTPVPCPIELQNAWLHVLMAFIVLANGSGADACLHLEAASRMLDAGNVELANQLRLVNVHDAEICPLVGVAALCVDKLFRRAVFAQADLATAFEAVVNDVNKGLVEEPLLRSHQDTIRATRHQIEFSFGVLDCQLDVVNDLIAANRPCALSDGFSQELHMLLPLVGKPRLDPILEDCRDYLIGNLDASKALCLELEETARWHRSMIASNKDQQEAAIAAFTMVTIIFLPLSWLSGIFGMNTVDIRELEYRQWLYWLIAIPFAFALGAGAWWLVGADQLAYLRRRRGGTSEGIGHKGDLARPRLQHQMHRGRPRCINTSEAAAAASLDRRRTGWTTNSVHEDTMGPHSFRQRAGDGWLRGGRRLRAYTTASMEA